LFAIFWFVNQPRQAQTVAITNGFQEADMEDMYRTHKEPAWGWIGVLLAAGPARKAVKPGLAAERRVRCA
jgi:hypothetical protein